MAVAALALAAWVSACSPQGGGTAAPEPVALVSTAVAEVKPVVARLRLYGVAEDPATVRDLAPLAEAVLAAVEVPRGGRVQRGQVVARLTPSPASALDLGRAQADARAAEAQLARAQRLRADGLASDAEVETARLAATSARSLLASLQARQGTLLLRAPFDGVVTEVRASVGDVLAPGATVATVAPLAASRARLGVAPEVARQLRAGDPVTFLDPEGSARGAAAIVSVDPNVDPATRLATVIARLPAGVTKGAGEPVLAAVELEASRDLPAIPYAAILSDAGQPYAFVVQDGRARRVNLALAATSDTLAAVRSGIRAGDVVVTSGATALEDGMKVRTR